MEGEIRSDLIMSFLEDNLKNGLANAEAISALGGPALHHTSLAIGLIGQRPLHGEGVAGMIAEGMRTASEMPASANVGYPTLPINHVFQKKPEKVELDNIYSRSTLPEQALSVLKAWFFEPNHVDSPYPTKEEKDELMQKTGLDRKQLDTWFCNARRRFKTGQSKGKRGKSGKLYHTHTSPHYVSHRNAEYSPDSVPMLPGQSIPIPTMHSLPILPTGMQIVKSEPTQPVSSTGFLVRMQTGPSINGKSDDEKKRKRRERNKESARKCRNKRRLQEQEIQEQVDGLAGENKTLQTHGGVQMSLFNSSKSLKEQVKGLREKVKTELTRLASIDASDEDYQKLFREWPFRLVFNATAKTEFRKRLLEQCLTRVEGQKPNKNLDVKTQFNYSKLFLSCRPFFGKHTTGHQDVYVE